MNTLQGTRDYCNAQSQSASPLPGKQKVTTKSANSETTKSDETSLEKPRPPSANSSSAVKPPYSYIALSNYHSMSISAIFQQSSHFIIFHVLPSNDVNSAITAKEINIKWNL